MTSVVALGSAGAQQHVGTCFYGPIRPACSGFIIFESSALASRGPVSKTFTFDVPTQVGPNLRIVTPLHDLPSYLSGSVGYLHVVDDRTAIGAVAELGFSTTGDLGNTHRFALTLRERKSLGTFDADFGAGPLGVEVFVPTSNRLCCSDRVTAYGVTGEGALMYRGLIGVTGGADLIHGGGRTSVAVHAGARSGSYATVVVGILSAAAAALLLAGLRNGLD